MRIDRPAEDDTPRAGPESRTVDTPSAASGHETPDRVAYATEYRATVDAAYREYRAAREWDEAVPALREAWENHEKKWTYPERAGPAVHPGSPGAWRGDGGRCLAPDANAEVTCGCARIREIGETVITPAMRRIEAEDPGRQLVGFEYRLKDPDRLKEKVADGIRYKGRTPEEALGNVKDAIRFTFVYPEERYSAGVLADCERLQAASATRHSGETSSGGTHRCFIPTSAVTGTTSSTQSPRKRPCGSSTASAGKPPRPADPPVWLRRDGSRSRQ